jgi:hypothetical protein
MTIESDLYALMPSDTDAPDWVVSTPGTYIGQWVTDLDGMTKLALQVRFMYGSGGTSILAYVQSSLDQGNTAYDVASLIFGTTSRNTVLAISQTTSAVIVPVDAAGEAEGVVAAIFGDRLRLKIVVTGTFSGTTLSARALPS